MTRQRRLLSLAPARLSRWTRHLGPVGEASAAESRAVLRLVAACQATGTDQAALLEAWGKESGICQSVRLRRLVALLQTQHSLTTALAAVPGVVRADHGLAIRFGSQLNLLGQTITSGLSRSLQASPADGRRRFLGGYLLLIVLLFLPLHLLIGLRILPVYAEIFADFGTELPAISTLGIAALDTLSWIVLWAATPVLAVMVLRTISLPVRRWLQSLFVGRESRAFAVELLAIALAGGVSFRTATRTLRDTHWNPTLRRRLAMAADSTPGEHLATARLIPTAAGPLIDEAIGNGRGSVALQQIADQIRAQQQRTRTWSTELLAPAVAAGLGLIVAIELLAVFTPLVKLVEGLS